jgi:hypothetical protein
MDALHLCTDRSPWVPAFAGTTELLLHRDKDVPRCRRSRHAFSCRGFRESEEYANLRNEVLGFPTEAGGKRPARPPVSPAPRKHNVTLCKKLRHIPGGALPGRRRR